MDNKISINDLLKKSPKEIKEILKKEGNTSIEDKQFDEWWSIFELTRICEKYELSELEKWCVLRGRFKIAPLIDPAPSTVESPFSKNQLKAIHNWANNNNEIEIARTCAHLLTNANEWPKEMLVGDHESSLKPCNVIYADPMNRFFVTKDEGDSDYYTWKICRPIEQKPKELSEIIKPKQKCYCIEAFSRYNFMDEAIFCEIFDDKVYIRKAGEEESKWITVSHFNSSFTLNPTPEQITAAEEAAINEVKERFDGLRKGGKGNG